MLTLILHPHIERGGYHLERFDACLGNELVVTSRQPLLDGARALLARGHDPDALLTIRHAGRDYDSFEARPIGELAKWTYEETSGAGMKRRRWRPFDASRLGDGGARTSEDAAGAIVVPFTPSKAA